MSNNDDDDKDNFWHDYRGFMASAIERNDRARFEKALGNAMKGRNIVRKPARLYEANEYGKPYTAFGQTDMAVVLLQGAAKWGKKGWIDMALDCLRPVQDAYPKGLKRSAKDGTVWLHAQTSTDRRMPGGTLNKHLIAAQNLAMCADLLDGFGGGGKRYRSLAIKATEQLSSRDFPNLDSFIYRRDGDRVVRSWIYYAVKFNRGGDGYWLSFDPKNATYHLLSMRVFERLHAMLGSAVNWEEFRKRGALHHLYLTYQAKMSDGGLYVASNAAPGGKFGATLNKPGKPEELHSFVTSFFASMA